MKLIKTYFLLFLMILPPLTYASSDESEFSDDESKINKKEDTGNFLNDLIRLRLLSLQDGSSEYSQDELSQDSLRTISTSASSDEDGSNSDSDFFDEKRAVTFLEKSVGSRNFLGGEFFQIARPSTTSNAQPFPKIEINQHIEIALPRAENLESLVDLRTLIESSMDLLIVIDMQDYFRVQRDFTFTNIVVDEIEDAIAHGRLIIFVEYINCGATIDKLLNAAAQYPLKCAIVKDRDSGLIQICSLLKELHISEIPNIRICGVETGDCVISTAVDLCFGSNVDENRFFPSKKEALQGIQICSVTVAGDACQHMSSGHDAHLFLLQKLAKRYSNLKKLKIEGLDCDDF